VGSGAAGLKRSVPDVDIQGMQPDPNALRYLPIFRARADELRTGQEGEAWQELRDMVARLVARLVCDHRTEARMIDDRPGIGVAACLPLSDCEAALRVEDGIFLISSALPWTSLRKVGTWRVPHAPDIVMIYAGMPAGTVLH
jgi:hypothetical protein